MPMEYAELTAWKNKVEKATGRKFSDVVESIMRKEIATTLKMIKSKTPVDTGRLRRGWSLGHLTIGEGRATATFVDPVEYASFVEYGTRKYKGAHMAETSILATKRSWPRRLRTQLLKFCEREVAP